MGKYQGEPNIVGGGKFVAEEKFGYELLNFLPFDGQMYGYVQPSSKKDAYFGASIDINKLGAKKTDSSIAISNQL